MNMRKHFILNIKVKGFKKIYVIFTPETPIFTIQDFHENSVIDTRVPHIVQYKQRHKAEAILKTYELLIYGQTLHFRSIL